MPNRNKENGERIIITGEVSGGHVNVGQDEVFVNDKLVSSQPADPDNVKTSRINISGTVSGPNVVIGGSQKFQGDVRIGPKLGGSAPQTTPETSHTTHIGATANYGSETISGPKNNDTSFTFSLPNKLGLGSIIQNSTINGGFFPGKWSVKAETFENGKWQITVSREDEVETTVDSYPKNVGDKVYITESHHNPIFLSGQYGDNEYLCTLSSSNVYVGFEIKNEEFEGTFFSGNWEVTEVDRPDRDGIIWYKVVRLLSL